MHVFGREGSQFRSFERCVCGASGGYFYEITPAPLQMQMGVRAQTLIPCELWRHMR